MATESAIDLQIARWIPRQRSGRHPLVVWASVELLARQGADDRAQIVARTRAPPFSFDWPIARIVQTMTS